MLQSWISPYAATRSLGVRLARPIRGDSQVFSFRRFSPVTCQQQRIGNARSYASDIVPLRKQLKEEAKRKKLSRDTPSNDQRHLTSSNPWELTVGIEIHAQLNTASKLFSGKPSYTI